MSRKLTFALAFACASAAGLPHAHADEEISFDGGGGNAADPGGNDTHESSSSFDATDKDSIARSWIGVGYFRTSSQMRRGPVSYDGKLLMPLNVALDISRPSFSLELVPRGFNEASTPGSRTFNFLFGPNLVRTDYKYGAIVEGLILRARFTKYLAQGDAWRLGAGLVLSDLIHVAEDELYKNVPAIQDAWFVTAGPLVRLDLMLADEVQARLGAAAAMGVVSLKDTGKRPYPISLFGHFRLPYQIFVGIESSLVVGVPHVFSQRHELQFGFFG